MADRKFITGYQGYFNPSQVVTIPAGESVSETIPTGGMVLAGLILPSLLTGTALTFLVGDALEGYQATGQAVFGGTTTDGDTITLNGVEITFVDLDPEDNEVLIGATAAETVANLQAFLDATEDEDLLALTYESAGDLLLVTAIEHGVAGNAIEFAKNSTDITLTPSGGFLTGGGFRPLYDASNAQVSMTVTAGRAYAVDPKNFQGVVFLQLKSGSTEVSQRTIICSLKGL